MKTQKWELFVAVILLAIAVIIIYQKLSPDRPSNIGSVGFQHSPEKKP